MKIGILGGTFNPVHNGHILAASYVREQLGLDKVVLLPDRDPPHKEMPQGSPDPETRLEMTRLAAEGVEGITVSDMELRREGKSYTSETMQALRAAHPDDAFYLIMGTDMFLTLHQWHEPETICANAVIVGLYRETKKDPEKMQAQKRLLEDLYGAQVMLLDNVPLEISSTMVRRMLVLGGVKDYLPAPVLDYIRARGLYETGKNYKNLPMEELRETVCRLLKKNRVNHVLGCAATAKLLAEKYGADPVAAERAGLLHDITKAMDGDDQLRLVDDYGIILSDFERKYPKLLHAKTGAYVARQLFGESEEICSAICWHTTGRPNMQLLEKIIYIADYMEPNRSFDGVEELRAEVMKDLDSGLLLGFEMCIAELQRENKPLNSDSENARDYLRRQLGRC